ncbi:AAA family ATPase [Nonomuraea sp. NN258]|uniref:AAA family ATPase n=1 Tax=Nonomuraea antri TaxID=2730852 RepID=UPI002E2882F9|nr:AAA family ATPase [Nonomuraea antri]NRQ34121.1 AAA family ATPase [Nonomuraea antri]
MTSPLPERAVVLITGISASGKSTVAEELARRLPRSAHVRGDAFRRMVVNGAAEMTPEPSDEAVRQLHLRYRIAAGAADLYAESGFTAVVQDVVLGPDLERFAGWIRSRPLLVVVLAPDAATVARRERERAKTGYGAWTVEQLDQALRRDTPRLGLWLDTAGQTPAETVDEILAKAADHLIK